MVARQAPLAQPPPGPGQGPSAVEVTLSGTLSLTGSSYVTESQEALRGETPSGKIVTKLNISIQMNLEWKPIHNFMETYTVDRC